MTPKDAPATAEELAMADEYLSHQPTRLSECPEDDGPCPYVTCRHHLWTERNGRSLRQTRAWGDADHTCVLRVVDEHPEGMTLDAIGTVLHVTRECVRLVEARAMPKMRAAFGHMPIHLLRDADATD